MVDFNNETTVSTPATNIVKVLLLQARAVLFEALEQYYTHKFNGITPNISVARARLLIAFLELQGYLKRTLPKDRAKEEQKTYSQVFEKLDSEEFEEKDMKDLVQFLNVKLDKLNITKIDTHKEYDRSSWEQDNKAHGY